MRGLIYILIGCVFSSCAIHSKFPFICFYPACVKQQFSVKPLKKRMQASLGRKRRKSSAQKNDKRSYNSTDVKLRKAEPDKDSIIGIDSKKTFGIVDTVVRIYYAGLSDSVLNQQKAIINSYIKRTGAKNITEISLTDIYSKKETDSDENTSLKKEIGKYLMDIGISKHRVYRRRNEHLHDKAGKYKERLYLEVRIH